MSLKDGLRSESPVGTRPNNIYCLYSDHPRTSSCTQLATLTSDQRLDAKMETKEKLNSNNLGNGWPAFIARFTSLLLSCMLLYYLKNEG